MSYLSLLFYPAIAFILLFGSKHFKKCEWNDEFLSLTQSKALQGFCALCIMFHHMSQRTCVSWIDRSYVTHGLDLFINAGYLMVAVFFFFSGYGLFKSYKSKSDYFKYYFTRRILPIIIVSVITELMFLIFLMRRNAPLGVTTFISQEGPGFFHPYTWYIYAIIYLYVAFFISFKLIKKEKPGFIFMIASAFVYIAVCDFFGYGTWWFNSILLFPLGIYTSRFEKQFTEFFRKFYLPANIISIVLFIVTFVLGNASVAFLSVSYTFGRWVEFGGQALSAVFFVLILLLWSMKLRIGNKILAFLGKITLELYLVHGFFVYLFSFAFIDDNTPSLLYIKNVFLYVLAVLVLSIPTAYLIHIFMNFINKIIKNKQRDALYEPIDKSAGSKIRTWIIVIAIILGTLEISTLKNFIGGEKNLNDFAANNLVYVESDGVSIAASVVGEGNETVVILEDYYDPSPVITCHMLANKLCESGNKVIIINRPGMLFSEAPKSKRTNKNMAEEIHNVLSGLGENDPVILVTSCSASVTAQEYAMLYPDAVKGIFAIDPVVGEMVNEYTDCRGTIQEFKRQIKREAAINSIGQKLMEFTGISPSVGAAYSDISFRNEYTEYKLLIESTYAFHLYGKGYTGECLALPDNLSEMNNIPYPTDIPVEFFLTEREKTDYNSKQPESWYQVHECQLTNPAIQHVEKGLYSSAGIYYNPNYFAEEIQEFIDEIE